ncbi:hypothetical protein CSA56_06220 [candidate division KSB3 bacterium]|uniref:Uncharacterized protein n=1 Tax=candidate division KSB3 bacterium TaxID=2044937 RepID=A0A2G6KH15_9BACT|nr:MAG: hypothetical protein CSA56_06220 [candidate division KSB3 bacterium]
MKNRDFQHILTCLYAGFALFVTFLAYVKTLAPTVSFFDSGELISAAYTLGIAHPPGYPLYVVLGWLFSKLPIGSSIAYRLNLMSACFAALSALAVYGITYAILTEHAENRSKNDAAHPQPDPKRMLQPVIPLIAAFSFAFSITHWKHAVIAEVYSLNAFLCGLIVLLVLLWRQTQRAEGSRQKTEGSNSQPATRNPQPTKLWLLYLVAFVFGLGFGNHQTIILLSVAACFLVLITAPRIITRPIILVKIFLALLIGLSIYLLAPILASQNPPINWGNPVTVKQFKWMISREGYKHVERGHALNALWAELSSRKGEKDTDTHAEHTPDVSPQQLPQGLSRYSHILTNSLLFKQFTSFAPHLQFGILGLVLALTGLVYGLAVHRIATLTTLVAVVTLVVMIVLISDPPEENIFLVHEFHTPAYLLMAVWIGLGIMAVSRAVLAVTGTNHILQYSSVFVLGIFFLGASISQMTLNLPTVDRRRNYVAYDYAHNVLNSLEPDAILFTWGDSGAFPLWYLQLVEDVRPDVTLIHVPHLSAEWFVDSLPRNLFLSADPFAEHGPDLFPILHEIVEKNRPNRPIYFDYSSTHSIMPPYPIIPNGIVYKIAVVGDTIDSKIWDRYRFRGILNGGPIASDPDIERTALLYGSARAELGHYYLELHDVDKAAHEFNMAVQLEPSLGDGIVQSLKFRDKLGGEQHAPVQTVPAPPH